MPTNQPNTKVNFPTSIARWLALVFAMLLGFVVAPVSYAATFNDGAPPLNEGTFSIGVFKIVVEPQFVSGPYGLSGSPNYPGFITSTRTLTSPLMYDFDTRIGRSAPHNHGDGASVAGVQVGVFEAGVPARTVALGDYGVSPYVVPGPFQNPGGVREVFTEVRKLRLATTGQSGERCSNMVNSTSGSPAHGVPGIPVSFELVTAGDLTPPATACLGQVQANGGTDFPARSFFNMFVNINLPMVPATAPWPGGNLRNDEALIVENAALDDFPPRATYIHGISAAVPVRLRDAGPWGPAGTLFGYLTLAGHGVFTNCPTDAETIAFLDEVLGPNGTKPGAPIPVKPHCVDFNMQGPPPASNLYGWGARPCAPNVAFQILAPGPSTLSTDYYLECRDQANASQILAGPDFLGSWKDVAKSGCPAQLCYDLKIFTDGSSSTLNLVPSFTIYSGCKGFKWTATNPSFVNEPGGANQGWHRICAPIALLDSNGMLPTSPDGVWTPLSGLPSSNPCGPCPATSVADWDTVLCNVTELIFPVDFTSNPAEVIGLDNICLTNICSACCVTITNKPLECVETNMTYKWEFCITNCWTNDVKYFSFVGLPAGVTLSEDIVTLQTVLSPGQGTCLTLYLTNTAGLSNLCFTVGAHTTNFDICCSVTNCITLPPCCVWIWHDFANPIPGQPNCYTYNPAAIKNVSSTPMKYLFLVPQPDAPNNCFSFSPNVITFNPAVPPGQYAGARSPQTVKLTINPGCARPLCFLAAAHDSNLVQCCSSQEYITAVHSPVMFPGGFDGTVFEAGSTIAVPVITDSSVLQPKRLILYEGSNAVRTVDCPPLCPTDGQHDDYYAISNAMVGTYVFRWEFIDELDAVWDSEPATVYVVEHQHPEPAPSLLAPALIGEQISFSMDTEAGVTCHVEYTTTLSPPNWTLLKTVVGDGSRMTVTDSLGNAQRFYRVRIDE